MKHILYFSFGAAIGAVTAWYLTKRYYTQIVDDVMEDVNSFTEEVVNKEENKKIYKEHVYTLGYAQRKIEEEPENPDDYYIKDEVEEELETSNPFPGERVETPYIIGPDEYHEEGSGVFDKETITYYAGNDVLVTDTDEVLEINDTIGRESLEHIGEYESDTVYVRNERLGMEFEVVCVDGAYEPD